LRTQYATSSLEFGMKLKISRLIMKLGHTQLPIFKIKHTMSDFRTCVNCGGMVMEGLEGCMQLGVATLSYIHRVVTKVLCNVELMWLRGVELFFLGSILCLQLPNITSRK
jgi:hypothetical protein